LIKKGLISGGQHTICKKNRKKIKNKGKSYDLSNIHIISDIRSILEDADLITKPDKQKQIDVSNIHYDMYNRYILDVYHQNTISEVS